jgi:hypothetical protein
VITSARQLIIVGLAAASGIIPAAAAPSDQPTDGGLVQQVRDATSAFRDIDAAIAAGYTSLGACVSGPQQGAMGIHYGGPFTNDGVLRPDQPDLLLYEQRGGELRLLGVEYLQEVAGWTGPPPVLAGQQFQFVDTPNRYGLGAFYELHVWAWKNNPNGTFADWNPKVSCDDYTGEPGSTRDHARSGPTGEHTPSGSTGVHAPSAGP